MKFMFFVDRGGLTEPQLVYFYQKHLLECYREKIPNWQVNRKDSQQTDSEFFP